MLCIRNTHKILVFLTGIALISAPFVSAASATWNIKADLAVKGQVTVNGERAVSNSTVVSGSKITTGSRSSAIIGLGSIGRVELQPETSLTLEYSDNSIVATLSSGKVRIANAAGIVTSVTTRSATVIGDSNSANIFSVDIGCADDVKCSQTMVKTTTGLVTLKTAYASKQVAAGNAIAGGGPQNGCKPCYRPGSSRPVPVAGFGSGGLKAILIILGTTIGSGIILGDKKDGPGDGGMDVSPIS